MLQELQISFFDCCKVEGPVITVRAGGHPRYSYIESAARLFTRWITVKANAVCRRFVHFCRTSQTRLTSLTRWTRVLAFAGGLRL